MEIAWCEYIQGEFSIWEQPKDHQPLQWTRMLPAATTTVIFSISWQAKTVHPTQRSMKMNPINSMPSSYKSQKLPNWWLNCFLFYLLLLLTIREQKEQHCHEQEKCATSSLNLHSCHPIALLANRGFINWAVVQASWVSGTWNTGVHVFPVSIYGGYGNLHN